MQKSQLINESFWTEYSRLYDKFFPSFQQELIEHISQFSFGKVGDFGAGTGKLYKSLSKNQQITQVHSYDSNLQMLKLAKEKLNEYFPNIPTQATQLELNNLERELTNESFDSIYLINALYPNKNPIKIIQGLNIHLNQNGILIVSDMKRKNSLTQLFEKIQQEYPNENQDIQKYLSANQILSQDSIPRTYSLDELESIIKLTGNYQIIEKTDDFFLNNSNCIIAKKN